MIIRNMEAGPVLLLADGLYEVEEFIRDTSRNWSGSYSVHGRSSHSWDLGVDYHGAIKLAKEGWPEGVRQVSFEADQVASVPRATSIRYDVVGDFPDVGRYCAGDPLHMRSRKRHGDKPVVTLIVNVCTSGAVSASNFAKYGGAVTALVDQLENEGMRVELYVVGVNGHSSRGRSVCGWRVKAAEDSLDLSAIAFSIAHPAAYRRLMFAMWERLPKRLDSGSGYGSVQKIEPRDAALMDMEGAVLMDGAGLAGNDLTTAELTKRLHVNVHKAIGAKVLD